MPLIERYVSALAGGSGDGTTEGTPYTYSQMITEMKSLSGTGGNGKRYNIKADGTYARAATDDTNSVLGTNLNPVCLRGYKTTPGDGYLGRSASGPLLTTNMPLVTYPAYNLFVVGKFIILESLRFQALGGNGDVIVSMETNSCAIGCVFTNPASDGGAAALRIRESSVVFECDMLVTATAGPNSYVVWIANQGAKLDSCRIISSSPTCGGINSELRATIYGCLLKGAGGGIGVYFPDTNRNPFVRNCTITGWEDGIRFGTSTDFAAFIGGNMITDNTGWALNFLTAGGMAIIGPNRTRDNVLGDCNNGSASWISAGRIIPLVTTDTGGPETDYVAAAAGDYNLVPTSAAKDGNRPKNSDLGAFGLPITTDGGGTAVFHPLRNFIIRPA